MGSGSGVDLFRGFNEGEVDEVLRRCVGCGRFVLIGPPRSGKTFFRENYLEGRLGAGVTVDEHTLGITTTAKIEGGEARGGSGLREKVMRILEGLIPLIRRFRDKVRVEDEELRRILGDRAPRPVVEGARRMIGDSPHRAYYIPWKCVEEPNACTFDADVSRALGLIKRVFDDRKVRIRWFRAEYIPPGLVKEVIDLIKKEGEDGAREVLEGWVDAYPKASKALSKVLGLGEDLLEWDELSIGFLSNFVNNLASYVISSLTTIPISAAALAIISVLTYMAFKREGEGYLKEIIELRRSLEGLLVKGPGGRLDFNELGKLLVYRVAYAMGMGYDEAKRALMDITGLSIDELERRVNEIERKIKELEEKIELFRQEVPAGIVTADVGEFAKGRIYPNIKVESGELRIRVEDKYHSIVRAGKFNELVNKVRGRLTSNGVVVVVGPKGIGKSTLAVAVIWELLMNGDIGLVARVDVLDSKNYSEFATFIKNYGEGFGKYFGRLLILYDPVSTKAYEKVGIDVETPIQTNIERTINNLMNVINSINSEASKPLILIVIPSDVYNALSGEMRNALEVYRLDVSQGLINTEFLAELVREYTRTRSNPDGCELGNDVLSKLASELVKFDSGHALIARFIGEELARNNCSASDVEKLINNAKSRAKAFIIQYINGLFKVDKDPDIAKVLVEVFALRRPFVNMTRPGDPILTPGIVELMGVSGLSGWLAIRQHDLIEEAIEELLDCIEGKGEGCEILGDALKPWKTIGESSRKASEEVRDEDSAVKYFVGHYGKEFTTALGSFSNKCWRRAALIIGYALAGHDLVPRPEDLHEDVRESIKGALDRCDVDYYLLVGNKISPIIMNLIRNNHVRVLTEAFIDKYDDAINEVNEILENARDRYVVEHTRIYPEESIYGLGLASIIAKAVELGRPIKPSDADAALRIVFTAFIPPDYVKSVLRALEPLRNKAPHRYLELQVSSLMRAVDDYISQLSRYGREDVVDKIFDLLNDLDRLSPNLGVIAWARVLARALENENVRLLIERKLDNKNVIDKTNEILEKLSKLKEKVWELMMDEVFVSYVESKELIKDKGVMGYVEFKPVKADEEAVRRTILKETSSLKRKLAYYKFRNDDLNDAARLFNEAAEVAKEIKEVKCYCSEVHFEDYLVSHGWALRVEAIKGSLSDDELVKLVNEFRQLFEDVFKRPTAEYPSIAPKVLGEYLVSLALMGSDKEVEVKEISELLKGHQQVLDDDKEVSVLTRLTLDALLSPKGGLSTELWNRLIDKPWELIKVFEYQMLPEFLTALKIIFDVRMLDDEIELCRNDDDCRDSLLTIEENDDAVKKLRERLINAFRKRISEKEVLDLLKELGFDAKSLIDKFRGLVDELDGASLVQLIAPIDLRAQLALMLYALINGDEELAKAHALMGAVYATEKLSARLFLEAYEACCDLKSESFRRAIVKLFLYHV
jgi:KaiC/GvpD/RAD55 family RecA-like ATPase